MRHDVACISALSPGGVLVIASNEWGAAVRLDVSGNGARQDVTA